MMPRGMGSPCERELGYRIDEFHTHLPYALRGLDWQRRPDGSVVAVLAVGHVAIAADPLPPLRIACLEVPRCRVRFTFDGVDAESQAAFLANFDRAFQRGGG